MSKCSLVVAVVVTGAGAVVVVVAVTVVGPVVDEVMAVYLRQMH